ncbi:ABC transporter ATP-binding protein [Granulosicoccus antarcticus]|uniref:sn-glycerol-3-phosphate import ATP-binding protein UgpC n=1 Tax=Granulosicoccus antarcticus IMCC3135 TaxID=1192854 RepID=A0A2Z2NP03_9GAMM|nr:ABC transporter ATP-binding protein [Granulosicoccus antarcticus]ASJ70570.1 sn-glycerol-3-phosphate import ATP-binding protein UgpC [Granulosicoccus antarcticus IMCC3135]
MLELDRVSKQVGASLHITDVSLVLEKGSLNVLLGPTLSGKTSLMRLMAGLDRPTSGRVLVDGKSVTGLSVRKRNVAMVYQQFINYPAMTVYENIASPLRLQGASKEVIETKVREAAELLKLTEFLDRTPLNLSGGQQQRTALARALVKGADLVLLDEPLANLDYKLREELRVELPRLFAETGAVLVYATTEPHEALLLGGKTVTLHEGTVTQFGTTIDVYNRPVDLQTAQTFSDPPLNTIGVSARDGKLYSGEHALGDTAAQSSAAALTDGSYTLAFRPHHISLSQSQHHTVPVNAIVGTSEITGSETYIHVSVEMGGEKVHWVVLTHGVHRVSKGDALTVYLDPSRYYLFAGSDGSLSRAPSLTTRAA